MLHANQQDPPSRHRHSGRGGGHVDPRDRSSWPNDHVDRVAADQLTIFEDRQRDSA